MAAHLVLGIEHILFNIFENLACSVPASGWAFRMEFGGMHDSDENERTLASAALACRAFSEPASKVLWYSLCRTGLSPLVQAWRNMQPEGEPFKPLSEERWARLDHLAARVRIVACNLKDPSKTDRIPRTLLARYAKTQNVIFPNLRILGWWNAGRTADAIRHIQVLASPTISTLYFFHSRSSELNWTVALRAFAERHRHIRCLRITVHFRARVVVPILPLLSRLQRMEVRCLDQTLLAGLADLPELETLQVLTVDTYNMTGARLPALRCLHLRAVSADKVMRLFECLVSPRLRSLCIQIMPSPVASARQHLIGLCAQPLVRQLAVVELQLHCGHYQDSIAFSHILSALEPLPIRKLSILTHKRMALSFSSRDLELIATAWPLLSTLHIELSTIQMEPWDVLERPTTSPAEHLSRPSLASVLALALACRELQTLQLDLVEDVSAEALAGLEDTYRPSGSTHLQQANLRELGFVSERYEPQVAIADPERLARTLRQLFPQLCELRPRSERAARTGGTVNREVGVHPDDDFVVTDYSRLRKHFNGLLGQE